MSDLRGLANAPGLPSAEDIDVIGAQLREEGRDDARGAAADSLVALAGREPHPAARAALLERAAGLVLAHDRERAALLLRESFRYDPTSAVGAKLIELSDADASLGRFGRMADVVDAVAALAPAESHDFAWLEAARRHVELGLGARALAALDRAGAPADAGLVESAAELRAIAESQQADREEALASHRAALAGDDPSAVAAALVDYAELLVVGDAPATDVTAVLADAAEAGVDPERIAALWAEGARAARAPDQLARALAAALATEQPPHIRLRTADELANLPNVDTTAPEALVVALDALSEALPDDLALRARMFSARALLGEDEAEQALESLRGEAVRSRDRAAEAAAALGLARIARKRGDDERVDRMLRRVRTLEPDNREALAHFEARYRANGEHERLIVLLGQRLALTEGDEAIAIATEIAQLAGGPLSSPERAADAWHRVLALAPDHDEALSHLAAHERESGDVVLLADLLERRASNAARRGDKAAVIEALDELVGLHGEDSALPDSLARLSALQRLAAIAPERRDVSDEVADALRAARRYDELATLIARRLDVLEAGDDATAAAIAALEIPDGKAPLALLERAAERIEADEGASSETLERAATLLGERSVADRDNRVVATWLRARSLASGDRATGLLAKAANHAADAGMSDVARALLAELVEAAPERAADRLRLGLLHSAAGEHDLAVARLSGGKVTAGDDEAAAALEGDLLEALVSARIARGDNDTTLERDLERLRALRPDAAVASEAALRVAIASGDVDAVLAASRTLKIERSALIERLVAEAEAMAPAAAVAHLSLAAASSEAASQRAELGAAAVERARAGDDRALIAATAAKAAAWAEEAGDGPRALVALALLAEASDGATRLAALTRRLDAAEAAGAHDQGFAAAVELLALRLGADAEAETKDATTSDATIAAVASLAQRLIAASVAMGDADVGIELVAEHGGARATGAVRPIGHALAVVAAEAALRENKAIGSAHTAMMAYLLGSDDGELAGSVAGWTLAERLASEVDDWSGAVDAIVAQADRCEGDEAVDLLLRAASLAEGAAGEHARAATLWARALEVRPEALSAWTGRLSALRSAEDLDGLARAIDELLATPVSDLELCCRAFLERLELPGGDEGAKLLANAERPMTLLSEAESMPPEGEAILAVVAARLDIDGEAADVAPLVARVARAHSRFDELARALEVMPPAAEPAARVEQLLDLAHLADNRLADGPRAFAALREAVLLKPLNNELWAALESLAQRRGMTAELSALIDTMAGLSDSDEAAVAARREDYRPALLERSARLAHAAGRLDDAASAYEALSKEREGAIGPLDALALIWREARDPDALCQVLERRLRCIEDAEERAIAWLELAETHRSERDDARAALATLAQATDDLPQSEALWAARLEALAASDDEQALIDGLSGRLASLDDSDADGRAAILRRRGLASLRSRPEDAVADLAAALTIDPTDDEAARAAESLCAQASPATLAQLRAVFETREAHGALCACLVAAAAKHEDPAVRAELLLALGRARNDGLGDRAGAFEAWRDGLAIAPHDDALVEALAGLAGAAGADGPSPAVVAEALVEAGAKGDEARNKALQTRALAVLEGAGDQEAATALRGRLARASGDDETFLAWIGGLEAAERWPEIAAAWLERGEVGGEAGRHARKEAARLLETRCDDADSARDMWIALAAEQADDAEAVGEATRLADFADHGDEVDAVLLEAARALPVAAATELRQSVAERAAGRGARALAIGALDALLEAAPDHDEGFALRGALLDAEGDAGALRAHLEQGVTHAATPEQRRARTMLLADHLAEHDAADAAFALLCGEIERTEGDAERDELVAIATGLATTAGLRLDAAALLATEAKRRPTGERAAQLLAAAALARDADDADAAGLWAREALADASAEDEAAAEAATLIVALAGDGLPDEPEPVVAALERHDSVAAAALLERLAEAGSGEVAVAWLERRAALLGGDVTSLRALALAAPGDDARWAALDAAYGDARRDEWLEALLAGVEAQEDAGLKATLLQRAATAAEAQGETETATAWLTLALELSPSEALRERLFALLATADQPQLLAEAALTAAAAEPDGKARAPLLAKALEAARGAGDDELVARVLEARAEAGVEDGADRVERLALAARLGHDGADDAVIAAFEAADDDDSDRDDVRRQLLPPALAAWVRKGDLEAAAGAYCEARADGPVDGDDALLADILDGAHALPPPLARELLGRAVQAVDASAEPGRWASLRLQLVAAEEDDDARLVGLDALVAHARGPLGDAGLAVEWSARALLQSAGERARVDAMLDLVEGGEGWPSAAPALAAALSMRVDGQVQADAGRLARAVAGAGADHDLLDAVAARSDERDFALAALDGLTPALRAAEAREAAQAIERTAIAHAGEGDALRVAGALVAAACDDPGQLQSALDAALAVAAAPEAAALFAELVDVARRADRVDAWLDAVEVALARDDVGLAEARDLAALAAGVVVEDLEDPGRAADLWTRIWDRDPDDLDARDAVLQLRRDAGVPGRLAVDLDRAVMHGGGGLGPLRRELATLLVESIERPRSALVHLRAQLDAESDDEATSAMLEQMVDQPALARDALDALVRAYRKRDDARGLADALERRVRLRGDRGSAEDLRELAALYSGALARPNEARKAATRAAAVARDTASADVLLGAALASSDANEVVEAAKTALSMGLSIEAQLDVARRALQWLESQGVAHPEREVILRSIIDNEPTDERAWVALDGLLEGASRWSDLVALREQRLLHVVDPSEHIAHLNELAALAAATGHVEAAVKAYRSLGALVPDDPTPWEALSELLANSAHHRERAEALEAWARRVDGEARVRALCEAARLHVSPLKDRQAAGRLYSEAFELDPSDDEAFVFLEKASAERPRELAGLYKRRADAMEPGPSRVVVLRKLAAIFGDIGDLEGARAALAQAFDDAPDNDALALELLEATEVAGDWEGYRAVAIRRLEGQLPRHERVIVTRKLARMAVDHDDDAERWLDALDALVPGDREAASLRGLMAASSDDPEVAASGLEQVVRDADDPLRKVRLLGRLARIYRERLHQPTKAISALQRLLRIDERRFDVHATLCELYTERGSHEALAEALRHWYDALDAESPDRAAVGLRLGATLLSLGQDDAAREPLEAAHAADPHAPEVLETLALHRMRTGQIEAAAELQLRVVERLRRTGQRDAVPAAAGRAAALLERVGQLEPARDHYRHALSGMPDDVDALLGLGRVSLALGDVGRALVELEKVARMPAGQVDAGRRAEAQVGLGHCWLRQKKKAQARTAFNRALELWPGMREALDGLSLT